MNTTCRVKNFTAFGSEESVIPLSTKGLTLIRGVNKSSKSKSNNGAGKSQILNAIAWGLFGKVPSGLVKADLVNAVSKKNCCVSVDVEIDGKQGKIDRYIADKTHKDNLYFTIDGEDKRGASNDGTQANINLFLGTDYESFMTAVLFTMDEDSSFAGKTPSNQDKVFSNLLKMDYLVKAKDIATSELKSIRNEKNAINIDKVRLSTTLSNLRNELANANSAKEQWEVARRERLSSLKERMNSLDLQRKNITIDNTIVPKLRSELDKLVNQSKTIDTAELENKRKAAIDSRVAIESSLAVANNNSAALEDELETAQGLNGSASCPTCKSPLNPDDTSKRIDELNKKLKRSNKNIDTLESQLAEVRKSITSIQKDIEESTSIKNLITKKEYEIKSKEREISDAVGRVEYITTQIKQVDMDIENTNKEQFTKIVDTFALEMKIENCEIDIEEIDKKLESLSYREELYLFWEDGFSSGGIRNLLVESIIPDLNKLAAKYSSILTGGELSISFSAQKELASGDKRNKLEVKVSDMYGSDSYHSSSGGEKRRIDLCVNITLHMLVAKSIGIPFVFLDESLVKLDRRGVDNALQLFRDLTSEIPSIFIVTNQDDIANEDFDNIWTVVREGRESKLEIGDI